MCFVVIYGGKGICEYIKLYWRFKNDEVVYDVLYLFDIDGYYYNYNDVVYLICL